MHSRLGNHRTIIAVVMGLGGSILLLWLWVLWPEVESIPGISRYLPEKVTSALPRMHPFFELLKLVIASVLGVAISVVHKHFHRETLFARSLEQAEILLCVAGALMILIIGDSLARAFGVLGAASIIRFRTPVEDPKDTTVLFLLLGIGMACGLGAFGVAILAALFICVFLFVLDRIGEQKPRVMMLELISKGAEFPETHVQNVFSAYQLICEPREVCQGKEASRRFRVVLGPNTPLDYLSEQLMAGGSSGLKSVIWEPPKKQE